MAGHIGRLITMASNAGWQVAVIATPDGRKFIDQRALAAQTGHPVRSEFKHPDETDVLPAADAILVAPATVNTVNKWACGVADTLALGLLIEGYGLGLPMAAVPFTNTAMAAHPAFHEGMRRLRSWGVRVLFGEDVLRLPSPGQGNDHVERFPWRLALEAMGPPRRVEPAGGGSGSGNDRPGTVGRNRRMQPPGRALPAPPAVPRPAPALLRP